MSVVVNTLMKLTKEVSVNTGGANTRERDLIKISNGASIVHAHLITVLVTDRVQECDSQVWLLVTWIYSTLIKYFQHHF